MRRPLQKESRTWKTLQIAERRTNRQRPFTARWMVAALESEGTRIRPTDVDKCLDRLTERGDLVELPAYTHPITSRRRNLYKLPR